MNVSRLLLLSAASFASCTVGPDFAQPGATAGSKWKQSVSSPGNTLPDDWWTLFGDAELNRLTNRAIAANNDITAAKARLDTARALVGIDRARLFPQLDVTAGAVQARSSQATSGRGANLEGQRYRSSFDLIYDFDLWGKNKRNIEAAQADADSAAALLDAQRLGIAAEVARQYFVLRGLEAQEGVLNDTLASRQESLDLEVTRNEAGLTDGLAPSRAKTELELARNDLANVQRQRGSTEHALAVLCGTRPADFSIGNRKGGGAGKMPNIRPGLPAEVMARRPDIRASLEQLRAANARIGAAEAEFYPSINLTGSAGLEAIGSSNFLDWENRVLSLGAGLAAPLIDGGARRSNYEASRSVFDAAMANHRQTLLVALREVEDALVDIQGLARSRSALEAALTSAEETRGLSGQRYDKGLSSYLEVVDADRSVLATRLALAQVDAQQRLSLAALAKALGGGWSGK